MELIDENTLMCLTEIQLKIRNLHIGDMNVFESMREKQKRKVEG